MKTWVRKTLSVGVLAAGALLFAPGAAHAGVSQDTTDNNGIANGLQFVAPVNIPINMVGNADSVLGHSNAAGSGVNRIEGGWGGVDQHSSDNNGIFNGAQAYMPFNIPINIVGNADSVLGHSNAAGTGFNGTVRGRTAESGHAGQHVWPDGQNSWDNNGIANGPQIYAPVDIPINICGNSFALLGEANAQAICTNSSGRGRSGENGPAVHQDSWDNNGIFNGAQLYAPFHMPVNLAGNSDAVLGHANAAAVAHNDESLRSHGVDQNSWDNNGIGNGFQFAAPVHIPVNICGNAFGLLGGEANTAAACSNVDGGHGGHDGNGGHGHGGHGQHGGNNGHGPDGNGGDNGDDDYAGDNGDQDGQYMGDHGDQGNGGAQGNGGTNYGSKTDSDGGRLGKSATEASPVDSLTQGVGGGLGGLDLLNTLR
jgi:primosomal replication protein N